MQSTVKRVVKKLYKLAPFKKELYSLLKKVWRVPERVYKHLSFVGVFKVRVEENKSFLLKHYGFQLENEIFWEGLSGRWEKHSMSLWIQLCKETQTIFDIGANTGVYSLVAKTVNPKSNVYAFEPIKTVFVKLLENINRNQFSVNCFEIALSNIDGKLPIYGANEDLTYTATLNPAFESAVEGEKTFEVEVSTLRSFIQKNNITSIDLMKIDVESHEGEVIEGFGIYLEKFKPVILIEIIRDYVAAKVMPYFEGLGYLYFNIDETKGVRKVDTVGVSDSFNYLFCSPEKARQLKLI
jgi:FkbM family methyltransferase